MAGEAGEFGELLGGGFALRVSAERQRVIASLLLNAFPWSSVEVLLESLTASFAVWQMGKLRWNMLPTATLAIAEEDLASELPTMTVAEAQR